MINLDKQLKKHPVSGEKEFYFTSSNLTEEIEYVNETNISNIELNPYVADFSETNIDFLSNIKNLKSLSIVALPNINISNINQLSSLEHLYLDTNKSKRIDLSGMNLIELNIRHSKSMIGLFSLKKLKTLVVSNVVDEFFFSLESFSLLKNLTSLDIVQSKIPSDFMFLSQNSNLKHLQVAYIRKPFTLNQLEVVDLKSLKIENCKKINIQNVGNLNYLEEFSLVDSVIVPDNDVFLNLPKLKNLIVLGSSFFIDGDLVELQNKLNYLGIDNKKHYNVKYIDPRKNN